MTAIPKWPASSGPRILTLVGNDLTIDVRARKTASSLARAGFSVISIGIDLTGTAPASENLDGAILHRVVPSANPSLSSRVIRLSRPEIRDSLRYRTEIQRQRLQMMRRNLTAWRHWNRRRIPKWIEPIGSAWHRLSSRIGVQEKHQEGVRRKIESRISRGQYALRYRVKRARVTLNQRRYQVLHLAYKLAAKPPKRSLRRGSWRRDLPELHRYEAAVGSVVDVLEPDLIHVHDVFHLGLAARAAARAAHSSIHLPVVYDAHEYIAGLPGNPVKRAAYTDLEGEYFRHADAVVTVSESMADAIETRYGLRPAVVMNTPDLETSTSAEPVRSVAGVPEWAKLIIYVGGIAPDRGAEELIEAIGLLPPDTYLVFVSGAVTGYTSDLLKMAQAMSLADRVLFVPFVPPEAVVSYIRSADVSVIPLSRNVPNYEVTLPNKLFQSIHAGVPVAVSDNPAMAQFVRAHGVGEVFEGGNPVAMVKAIQSILHEPGRYQSRMRDESLLRTITWGAQVQNLIEVYRSLDVEAP